MPWELVEEESPKEIPIKSIGKESIRNTARQASNILTRAAGFPGDIATSIPEKSFLGMAARKVLPTTEQHRENLSSKFGEYLKPQNKVEQFVDDIIEDTALLLTPGSSAIKGIKASSPIMKGVKALTKSLGANLLGETTEQISGSEKAGALAKMGSLFFLSLMGQPSAKKQIGSMYSRAEELLPEGAILPGQTIAGKKFSNKLNQLEKKITVGRSPNNLASSEKFTYDEVQKMKELIEPETGNINIKQLLAQKRSLNEELTGKKLFELDRKQQHRARHLAKELTGFVNEAAEQYGKSNPEFHKLFRDAEMGFGALAQSNKVANFVEKNIKYNPVTVGLLHLFGKPIGAVTATAIAPYQIYKIGYRMSKSPALRKIYENAAKAAIKEDSIVFNKELAKLDSALQKDESKEKWEFID